MTEKMPWPSLHVDAYQQARMACEIAKRLLEEHDFDGLLDAISRADSVGAILDPTLYREKIDAMLEDRKVFEAARRFLKTWPAEEPESHGARRSE